MSWSLGETELLNSVFGQASGKGGLGLNSSLAVRSAGKAEVLGFKPPLATKNYFF